MTKLFLLLTVSVSACTLVKCQRTRLDSVENIRLLRLFKEFVLGLTGGTGAPSGRSYHDARVQRRIQDEIPYHVPFPCNITGGTSEVRPVSIHRLRPGDIDVIAAMGDSLTAGFGIYSTHIGNLLIENRGASAFGGGQGTWRDTLTLPNILKEFNPKLFGFATGDSYTHQPASQFNVAESVSMSRDMPYMAQNLVNRMRNDPRVDVENHWKSVSIFIGANDFCTDMCWNPSAWASLDNHKTDMIKTLRILRDNLPRTLVLLIPPPHLRALVEMKGRSKLCRITTDFECSCLIGLTWRNRREEFYEIMRRWQLLDEEIGMYPEFQTDDFAVVVQPFPTRVDFPTLKNGITDFRYLSTDCFHLSQISNARTAFSLWRNLLEPVGRKTRSWDELGTDLRKFPCPTTERPYIATVGNSF